jgi:N-methylhydantoinase A
MNEASLRIAADVGGTFTDVAVFDEITGRIRLGKSLTTPKKLVQGMQDGVTRAGESFDKANLFLHGTTVAINTLLERNGAKTALITTQGFRDIYEIGRINRPEAYNLFFKKHKPLIDRYLRFEVSERLTSEGSVLRPLKTEELELIAQELERHQIEAVCILFMHSYSSPDHELKAKEFLTKRLPNLFVSASCELSQEYREFERTSTVAANAYIGPKVKSYLTGVVSHLKEHHFTGRFLIVQSTGGLYSVDQAQRECIRMIESGPAAGLIATKELCRYMGIHDAIAFDMGGTTAKSGVILNGDVMMTSNSMIGGYTQGLPIQIPMIDIQEVGTGGGSIARIGPANSLRVGPQSAGSEPGPVCYGLGGGEPTVTDANLILGRLSAERFLGGDMKLDPALCKSVFEEKLARPLGLSVEQAAEGVIKIAAATMSNVVKRVTTERGVDARDFPMVAFGGAGPLHALLVAKELKIKEVIIPNAPGHFSAYGMLVADLRRDYVRTLFIQLEDFDFEQVESILEAMESEGSQEINNASPSVTTLTVSRGLDMRYVGQEHAVTVEIAMSAYDQRDTRAIKAAFDKVHLQRYGYFSEKEAAEIVSVRTSVTGHSPKPSLSKLEPHQEGTPPSLRRAYIDGAEKLVPVYWRPSLGAGFEVTGPAFIEEYASTTTLFQNDVLRIDEVGNLRIEVAND